MRRLLFILAAVCLLASFAFLPRPMWGQDVGAGELPAEAPNSLAEPGETPAPSETDAAEVVDRGLDALLGSGWIDASEHRSIHDLLDLGREQEKPLLLLFRRQSCGSSWALEQALLDDPGLKQESERFVRAVVDQDGEEGRALATSLHVLSAPTILVLTKNQQELARVGHGESGETLATRLRGVAEGSGTITELEKAAILSPFDIHLAFELGRWHALRGDSVGAKRHFGRIFVLRRMLDQSSRALVRGAADVGRLGDSADFGPIRSALEMDLSCVHEEVDTLLASAYFMLGEYVYLRGREDPAHALRIFEDLRRRFPDSPEARRVGLSMASAHQRLGSSRRALAELSRHHTANAPYPDALAAAFLACLEEDELAGWAADAVEEEIVNYPDHAGLHYAAARLRERAGDLPGALGSARRVMELSPNWAWYRKEHARIEALQPVTEEEEEDPEPEPDEIIAGQDEEAETS